MANGKKGFLDKRDKKSVKRATKKSRKGIKKIVKKLTKKGAGTKKPKRRRV